MDEFLDKLAEVLAKKLAKCLGGPDGNALVGQGESPLGPRKHCAAVRRRLARSEGGAARVGKRYLLTQEALQAELRMESGPVNDTDPPAAAALPVSDPEDDAIYESLLRKTGRK